MLCNTRRAQQNGRVADLTVGARIVINIKMSASVSLVRLALSRRRRRRRCRRISQCDLWN